MVRDDQLVTAPKITRPLRQARGNYVDMVFDPKNRKSFHIQFAGIILIHVGYNIQIGFSSGPYYAELEALGIAELTLT